MARIRGIDFNTSLKATARQLISTLGSTMVNDLHEVVIYHFGQLSPQYQHRGPAEAWLTSQVAVVATASFLTKVEPSAARSLKVVSVVRPSPGPIRPLARAGYPVIASTCSGVTSSVPCGRATFDQLDRTRFSVRALAILV